MNELQQLQEAYRNGTITPQQAERLKELMGSKTYNPVVSRIKSMFQGATPAYYDESVGDWAPKGTNADYSLSGQFGVPQQSNPFQELSIEDSIKYNPQARTYLPQGYNLSRAISDENKKSQPSSQTEDFNPFMSDEDLLASEQRDAQQFFDIKTRNPMQDGTLTPLNSEGWKKGLLPSNTSEGEEGMPKADMFRFPMINPGGSDLSTEIYSLGRALGTPKGTPGRGMNIVGAGGAAALDIARNLASGIGFSKRNQYVMDWYKKKQQERNYTPDSQSEDQNSTGGFKLGGTMNMFAEDGMTMPEGQPQEQIPQEQGQDQQMQQVVQMIAGMLQQGANPQQVLEELVRQGLPQQEAEKLVQMVMQQMQGQQAPAPEQPQDQQMVMKNGGTFDKRVGESVTIKVGGKKVKGVIKEIKNGQITLK
jgi:polyhydroxyalkanoate synthesis regulator phasin